ncbi:hypothetical protein NJD98_004511 [Salmonella enterica]|nr:hypothetical protein [Salmonella enterica]EJL2370541.1 hypothetical protein [Salmonella enterica]
MHNLSERYIEALKLLPQYYCCYNFATDRNLTHVMSGARVFPVNEDESILEIQYLSGHKVRVYAEIFLDFAIKEAVEFFSGTKGWTFKLLPEKGNDSTTIYFNPRASDC